MNPVSQQPPTIEFGDFRLRPLRQDDAADLFAYLQDPRVTERTSFPEVTLALAETMVERATHRWASGEVAKWGVARCTDDRLIGTCGFNEWTPSHRRAELAYDLAREHWGARIMQRVVHAVLDWTYEHSSIDRVFAYVRVDNRRSSRLLERCGFQHEGCLRHFRVCRGEPFDFDVFGLLRADWLAIERAMTSDSVPPTPGA